MRFKPSSFGRRQRRFRSVERFVPGNQVDLYPAGTRLFEEMLNTIDRARELVCLEMYWFSADVLGQQFFAALSSAAERGVRVYVLYDAFGSIGTATRHFSALQASGAEVAAFNPVSPFKERFHLERLTRRNHRKLLLTESYAYVGGVNLTAHSLAPAQGGEGWRDDVVRAQGPILQELFAAFRRNWLASGGCLLRISQIPPAPAGSMQAAVLTQAQYLRRQQALDAYLSRVWQARQSVYLTIAYFVPNRRIIRGLVQAAQRGVDVRIILPARSDVEVVRLASQAAWSRLLKAGVRIFLWQPSVLHCKSAVIDGEWSTVGSFNLDYISVRNNAELNISVLDGSFAELMTKSFYDDLLHCEEVSFGQFDRRSITERAVERSLYWFRQWL